MRSPTYRSWILALALIAPLAGLTPVYAQSEDPANATPPATGTGAAAGANKVDVQKMKEKFWAKGDQNELRVVQNRLYSPANRGEFGLYYGWTATSPFLSVKNLVATLGYHFNEYFGVNLLAIRYMVQPSSALITFQAQTGNTVSSNYQKDYLAGEASFSPLYGKLSVLGQQIIYFDLHVLAGVGRIETEAGNYISPEIGVGQQVYLNKWFSLRMDYRVQYYSENVLVKPILATGVRYSGSNNNFSNIFVLGGTVMFP